MRLDFQGGKVDELISSKISPVNLIFVHFIFAKSKVNSEFGCLVMHVFLDVNSEIKARIDSSSSTSPMWFAAPLASAFGHVEFGRSVKDVLLSLGAGERNFLIFNVGLPEVIFSMRPRTTGRVISLYQWRPKALSNPLSHLARQVVLRRSDRILTYSQKSAHDLRIEFGDRKVKWIPHFVDTDYFSPSENQNDQGYLICVGDHLRLENIVERIQRDFQIRVIRVTNDERVKKYYHERENSGVDLRFRIPFSDLRRLYQEAKLVINPVDDRYWPVGITTFCEAIAMARPIVTSGNHSCSGYLEYLDPATNKTVTDPFDEEAWLSTVGAALNDPLPSNDSGRRVSEMLCSREAMAEAWASVLD